MEVSPRVTSTFIGLQTFKDITHTIHSNSAFNVPLLLFLKICTGTPYANGTYTARKVEHRMDKSVLPSIVSRLGFSNKGSLIFTILIIGGWVSSQLSIGDLSDKINP